MIKHCPFCEIKEAAQCRHTFFTLDIPDGGEFCQECGAYIDLGQLNVKVNSYKEMYNGVLRLIGGLVDDFNEILDFAGIDLKEYGFENEVKLKVKPWDIAGRVFVSGYGGTTKRNFLKALGIQDEVHEFVIQDDSEGSEW